MDKLPRWRREGLLSREIDWRPQAFHGSVVRYPKGTCAQIRAIATLFKEKNRIEYVGSRLWRQGCSVDEKHWRPRLQKAGRQLDRLPSATCQLERAYQEAGALKLSADCQDSISYTSRTVFIKFKSDNEVIYSPTGDPVLATTLMRCPL
jgi:hypothetical protein